MKIEINKSGKNHYWCEVDGDDFPALDKHDWTYHPSGYAYRHERINDKIKKIYMHREILGVNDSRQIDHKNGDRLDNRKCNLRIATQSQNSANSKPRKKYKGSHFNKRSGRWTARIWKDYKPINLGAFNTEIEAAIAYNKAAIKYFGEFAKLNEGVE